MGFFQWLLNIFHRNTASQYSEKEKRRQEEEEEEEMEELIALDII